MRITRRQLKRIIRESLDIGSGDLDYNGNLSEDDKKYFDDLWDFTFKFNDPNIQALIDEMYDKIDPSTPDGEMKIIKLDSKAKKYGYEGESYYADRSYPTITLMIADRKANPKYSKNPSTFSMVDVERAIIAINEMAKSYGASDNYAQKRYAAENNGADIDGFVRSQEFITGPGGKRQRVVRRDMGAMRSQGADHSHGMAIRYEDAESDEATAADYETVERYFPKITAVLGTPQDLENKMLEQEKEGMSTVEIVGSDVAKAFEGNRVGKPYSRLSSSNYPNFTFWFVKDEHPEYSWRAEYYGSADYISIARK